MKLWRWNTWNVRHHLVDFYFGTYEQSLHFDYHEEIVI